MTIFEKIQLLDKDIIAEAEEFLTSNHCMNIQFFMDEIGDYTFEAVINEDGELLLPMIEVDPLMNISDWCCQCCDDDEVCVHKAALLLGSQKLLATGSFDLNTAMDSSKPDAPTTWIPRS